MPNRGIKRATVLRATSLLNEVADLLRRGVPDGPSRLVLPIGKRDAGVYCRLLDAYSGWLIKYGLGRDPEKTKEEEEAKDEVGAT